MWGDEEGIWGVRWFSWGRGGNQKQTDVLMRCYLISDWYKTLSNWSALWERWLPGTAVTGSDVCWCAPASSMTFLKVKARATESCHVEQSRRWRAGYRNHVTNLISLVTIYFPWQIGSLLRRHKGIQPLHPGTTIMNIHFAIHFIVCSHLLTSPQGSEKVVLLDFFTVGFD